MRTSEFAVLVLVEAEHNVAALDQNGTPNQVRVLHHQVDGLFLGFRQRPFLPDGATRADEVEKAGRIDVLFEEVPRRGFLVDVELVNLEPRLVQITSGILAGGSRRLGVEGRLCHEVRIVEDADRQRDLLLDSG
jgi:hypothetical protein